MKGISPLICEFTYIYLLNFEIIWYTKDDNST